MFFLCLFIVFLHLFYMRLCMVVHENAVNFTPRGRNNGFHHRGHYRRVVGVLACVRPAVPGKVLKVEENMDSYSWLETGAAPLPLLLLAVPLGCYMHKVY